MASGRPPCSQFAGTILPELIAEEAHVRAKADVHSPTFTPTSEPGDLADTIVTPSRPAENFCSTASLPARKPAVAPDTSGAKECKRALRAIGVFSGSGELSLALRKKGFVVEAIDFAKSRDRPKIKTRWFHLGSAAGQRQFWQGFEENRPDLVSIAAPSSTSSLARLSRRKNPDGTPAACDPRPLRSQEFPDGLPGLQNEDLEKVVAANVLYKFVAKLVACELYENKKNELHNVLFRLILLHCQSVSRFVSCLVRWFSYRLFRVVFRSGCHQLMFHEFYLFLRFSQCFLC